METALVIKTSQFVVLTGKVQCFLGTNTINYYQIAIGAKRYWMSPDELAVSYE